MSAFTFGRSEPAAGRDARSLASRDGLPRADGSGALARCRHRAFATAPLLIALCALAVLAAASPANAAKAPVHEIGTVASGAATERFNAPRAIAINNTGNGGVPAGAIYVADSGNQRIQSFDADGAFLRTWGWDVGGLNEAQTVDRHGATGGTYRLCKGDAPTVCTNPIGATANAGGATGPTQQVAGIYGGPTNIVAGSGFGANIGTLTFQNALGSLDMPQLICDGALLTGGSQPGTCTVTTVTEGLTGGGPGFNVCDVDGGCRGGTSGTAAGQIFSTGARGISVNQGTGDVYVFDAVTRRVQQFSATGDFIRMWGADVIAGGSTGFEICSVAAECKTGIVGFGAGEFGNAGSAIPNLGTDSLGNVYVADPSNARVQKFDADGNFLAMAGWNVDADDPSTEFEVCDSAASCQAGSPGAGAGRFSTGHPSFLAVSPGGDVYLVDATAPGKIVRLDSSLALVDAEFAPAVVSGGGNLRALAVNEGDGHLFLAKSSVTSVIEVDPATELSVAEHAAGAADWVGLGINSDTGRMYAASGLTAAPGGHLVRVLDEGVLPKPTIAPAEDITGTSATLKGTVDPEGVELDSCAFRYGRTTGTTQTVPCVQTPAEIGDGTDPVPVHVEVTGLAPNKSFYGSRLVVSNSDGSVVSASHSFLTEMIVLTDPANAIGAAGATLHGKVKPGGELVTECFFEYGKTTAYGETVPCAESEAEIGEGDDFVPVHAELGDLDSGSAYHFRLVMATGGGDPAGGADESFLTLGPVIVATWSEDVAFAEARVGARINPKGKPTTYRFEYGTTDSYGAQTQELAVGADSNVHAVTRFLQGLEPATTYHFRVVATNEDGSSLGPDRTFATSPALAGQAACPNQEFRVGPSADLPNCRAYEMVSPIDKNGGDIESAIEQAGGGSHVSASYRQASIEGGKITFSSSMAFGDVVGGHFANQYVATRGAEGWSTRGISSRRSTTVFEPDVPIQFQIWWALFNPFQGFAPDLSSGWVRDDNVEPLRPDALEGYVNVYRRDIAAGGYETLTTQHPYGPHVRIDLGRTFASGGPRFLGASADLGHQVFALNAPLTPDAPEIPQAEKAPTQVYDKLAEPTDARQRLTVRATGGQYALSVEAVRATGTLTNGSALVAGVEVTSSARGFEVGDPISANGVPAGTTVASLGAGTLTLSQAAEASGAQTLVATEATGPLSAVAPPGVVQGALEGLAVIGEGNVVVTGGSGDEFGTTPYLIRFTGDLSGTQVSKLRSKDFGLVGGSPSSSAFTAITDPGGDLKLVSVLPNGEPATTNAFAGTIGRDKTLFTQWHSLKNAVSEDGSVIFWSQIPNPDVLAESGRIYARLNPGEEQSAIVAGSCTEPAKACTVPVSETATSSNAVFLAASADGERVLFSSGSLFDQDATRSLYLFDVATRTSTRIADQVRGAAGAADDLSRVYFVSRRSLAAGAVAGEENLYVYHGGSVAFIAPVSVADVRSVGQTIANFDITTGTMVEPRPNRRTTRVSPDGLHLAFMSNSVALAEDVAGYDTTDVVTGKPDFQVYHYDAATGQLSCVSCKPSGARPRGTMVRIDYDPTRRQFTNFPDLRVAASIPAQEQDLYASRLLSDDGNRLFFHSDDALLPRDTNGTQDVYQWQREGTGGCEVGDGDHSARNNGCLRLISTGRDGAYSEFVDADPSGDEVFISTDESLDSRDPGARDIYVAKVGGGFPLPGQSAECEGEACQSPPPAPEFGSPSSKTFEGPGNQLSRPQTRCNRNQARRNGRCVGKRKLAKRACAKRKGKVKQRCVSNQMRRLNRNGRAGR